VIGDEPGLQQPLEELQLRVGQFGLDAGDQIAVGISDHDSPRATEAQPEVESKRRRAEAPHGGMNL
jgi:hypothetical protein